MAIAVTWPALVLGAYFIPRLFGSGPWRSGLEGPVGIPLHLAEAAARALSGLGGAALLIASAGTLGWLLVRALGWRLEGYAERIAHPLAIGMGAYGVLGFLLATAGLYSPWVLRAVVLAPLLAWLVPALRPRPLNGLRLRALVPRGRDRAWAAVAGLAAAIALIGALAPEVEYDALWYHLNFPRLALEQGRLVDLPDEYVSLYPMTWGLWYGYGLALGGQIAAKLLHWACLPLAALVIFDLAACVGRGVNRWLAVAIFAAAPTVIWQAGVAYNDLMLALYTALAVHVLIRFMSERNAQWLVMAALFLGVALASKHVTLVVLAVACTVLTAALWWRERSAYRALGAAVALSTLAVLVALPWYVRSWWLTGNPVFPELFGFFGAPAERWDAISRDGLAGFMALHGRERTAGNLLTLPWHMSMEPARYSGSFGPLLLALVPLALLRRLRQPLSLMAAFALAYFVLWASPLASYQLRWLMPVLPLMAVLAATGFARLSLVLRCAAGPKAVHTAWAVVLTALVLQLPPFGAFHERNEPDGRGWIAHTVHELPAPVVFGTMSGDAYLQRMVPGYDTWSAARDVLPADAFVLVYGGGEHFYSHTARIPALSPRGRRTAFAPADSAEVALSAARALGITHVFMHDRFLARYGLPQFTWEDFGLTRRETRERWMEKVVQGEESAIYRLRD